MTSLTYSRRDLEEEGLSQMEFIYIPTNNIEDSFFPMSSLAFVSIWFLNVSHSFWSKMGIVLF